MGHLPYPYQHVADKGQGQNSQAHCLSSAFLCPSKQQKLCCAAQARYIAVLTSIMPGKGEGQLLCQLEVVGQGGRASFPCSHHHTADEGGGTRFIHLTPSEQDHPPMPQGQLYSAAQLKHRANSPECCNW